MHSTSRTQSGVDSIRSSRIRRGLRFVAIVWLISGAFLALQLGLPELTHRLVVAGWIPTDLALPEADSVAVQTGCEKASNGLASSTPDPSVVQHARFASWKLGHNLGFAAGLANLGRTPDQLAPLMRDVAALGSALGVPAPRLPEIRHAGYAFAEYQAFIRTDPQCVAATLAARFGETAARHYRFGLVVGYVVPARAGNFGVLFPAELRHYGQLAGIPDTLFQPLTQEVLPGPRGAAPAQLLASIVEQLDSYILSTE